MDHGLGRFAILSVCLLNCFGVPGIVQDGKSRTKNWRKILSKLLEGTVGGAFLLLSNVSDCIACCLYSMLMKIYLRLLIFKIYKNEKDESQFPIDRPKCLFEHEPSCAYVQQGEFVQWD